MATNQSYSTLSKAVEGLQHRGFSNSFKVVNNEMICIDSNKTVYPKDVHIVEFHRFEGESNPSDMSIVYAVECKNGDKGIIVTAYGMYADMELVEFIKAVELNSEEMIHSNE
ncbi:MAG: phosphoribosylpyrophosphate synthetase [Chitinophagales bacterium]